MGVGVSYHSSAIARRIGSIIGSSENNIGRRGKRGANGIEERRWLEIYFIIASSLCKFFVSIDEIFEKKSEIV